MYDRLFIKVCGMFNPLHYITIVLFFALLVLILYLSRSLTEKQVVRLQRCIAIAVLFFEILKICVRILQGQGPDSWVPLYYCSLFIFAIWLSQSRVHVFKRAGYAYTTMGGIVASAFFTIYPSTSLGMYPLIHPASVHSFLYHFAMCYTGLLVLQKGAYAPQKRDGLYYFVFVFSACVLAAFLNETIGTNCMFLRDPFGLPILQPILEASKPLYMLIVAVAQSVCIFWAVYGLYVLFQAKAGKRK